MNVAVIGAGGREHALAYKIAQSPQLDSLYIIPGNPGTESLGKNIAIDISQKNEILNFCKSNNVKLVIVGPEQPLVDGLSDLLRANDIFVFGPSSKAAEIEGDKSFAKNLMKKYGIPTASFEVFKKSDKKAAFDYLHSSKFPVVIKASGLAAGKGVIICKNFDEGIKTVDDFFEHNRFGESGHTIVIEEFMEGEEASIFAVTDGEDFIILPPAQDHKRIGDGDTGPNTGGMGAYAPAPIVTNKILTLIEEKIISKTLDALQNEGKKFIGCLYCGLMFTDEGPKVVEFNCRFGDPETQCVLPLLEGDFLKLLFSSAGGSIEKDSIHYNGGSSVCVVAASQGYPNKYEKGFEIKGLDSVFDNVYIFHAGTKKKENKIITNGGRVLGITSFISNNNLTIAKQIAYDACNRIYFNGIIFRNDIADRAIK
ncbi:MAG: phosphoribosylamine--glycine ligase [Melioribacteraceae bacterium]|nr:phosphoribosylamine--glycine ligase [Melioribacteraceae bacterium]